VRLARGAMRASTPSACGCLAWPTQRGSVGGGGDTERVGDLAQSRWAAGYREFPAPAGTGELIACLWIRGTPPGPIGSTTAVVPDGCADLIWQEGYGAFIAGPDTGPAPATTPPDTILVGARFRPGAGGPALGLPLAELRDQRIDLAALLPALAKALPGELDPEEVFRRITQISWQLSRDARRDPVVLQATAMLAAGPVSVTELARGTCVSERQLLRRFDAAVGYGPKTLHRVIRFSRALAMIYANRPGVDLAAVANLTGYSDQAHLTREVTRMAGLPPAALARRAAASRQLAPSS
jgi:AraC-like DNA-binding protein